RGRNAGEGLQKARCYLSCREAPRLSRPRLPSPEAARLQMLVTREDIRGDFENHMIAAVVFLPFRDHHLERRLVGDAVVDRDYCSIGHCEDVVSEGIMLLDLLAIPVIDLVVLYQVPVDKKVFSSLDAAAINDPWSIPVDVGLAATGGREPAIPRRGDLIRMAGWRLIVTSG